MKMPKIFLDSGNPEETKRAKELLGNLDGQTTNPTLVTRHPEAQKYLEEGKKLTKEELLTFYKAVVEDIEKVTDGAISVEVYADWETTASDMLKQAHDMYTWGKNIYMKFPTIPEGVKAANHFVAEGGRVNMTLVFNQSQAASVYAATLQAKEPAFISPFMGRWDDRGYNGVEFLKNLITMYKKFNEQRQITTPHILVLAASIRTMTHLMASIFLQSDIMTMPLKIIEEWAENGKPMPQQDFSLTSDSLKSIPYEDLAFQEDYATYPINKVDGDLLDEGLQKFAKDWNNLLIT